MSENYYLVCRDCKKSLSLCSHGMSGFQFYSGEKDCMQKMREWMEWHTFEGRDHKFELLSEHNEETWHDNDIGFTQIEWQAGKQS